jgi:tetratricopeptide (TPR) repeat protein
MAILSAENAFRKGLGALAESRPEAASHYFRKALDLERERSTSRLDMRYLSYYGLSLARAGLSGQIALQACKTAVFKQNNDPLLFLNLGRVYILTGKLTRALEAFEKGLRLAPDHKMLKDELAKIDRRLKPAIPFLDRSHPVNRWIGRHRYSRRNHATEMDYANWTESPP